jgi:drug/metabolite transporter (DMT)-like permease
MDWFSLTLLSQALLISYYFFSKKLLNKAHIDPRLYGACLKITIGSMALLFAVKTDFYFEFTSVNLMLLGCMAGFSALGVSLYYIGLKHVDLSEASIFDATGVVWSLIFGSTFLQEIISINKILGSSLLLFTVLLISIQPKTFKFKLGKYESFLLLAPVFFALGAILDTTLLKHANVFSYMGVSVLSAGLVMLITNSHRIKQHAQKNLLSLSFQATVLLNAGFIFGAYYCLFTAYQLGGEVSRMYPLQQIQSFVIPLVGIVLLKERNLMWRKIIAAGIAVVGVLLLRY